MDIEQFVELYKVFMEKYSWKSMYEDFMSTDDKPKHRRRPKYIRFSVDTRDGEIWCVTFQKSPKEDISFRLDDKGDVEAMFKWLDEEEEVL